MEIEKFFACVAVHALMELMDPDNIPRRVSAQRHEEEYDIAVHGKLVLCNYHLVMRPSGIGRAFPAAVALSLLVAGVCTGLVPQADKKQLIIAQDFLDVVVTYSLTDLMNIYKHDRRHARGQQS